MLAIIHAYGGDTGKEHGDEQEVGMTALGHEDIRMVFMEKHEKSRLHSRLLCSLYNNIMNFNSGYMMQDCGIANPCSCLRLQSYSELAICAILICR